MAAVVELMGIVGAVGASGVGQQQQLVADVVGRGEVEEQLALAGMHCAVAVGHVKYLTKGAVAVGALLGQVGDADAHETFAIDVVAVVRG